ARGRGKTPGATPRPVEGVAEHQEGPRAPGPPEQRGGAAGSAGCGPGPPGPAGVAGVGAAAWETWSRPYFLRNLYRAMRETRTPKASLTKSIRSARVASGWVQRKPAMGPA